ncbi:unnamed protein product [Linum tenue]|uniref:Agglutinin domain-containing protein n=1 Tax=Linum tenue TaxID=586396 RepID=A0AAV0KH35_9ROSI|nr:unnamed protein product [Linum tenue]
MARVAGLPRNMVLRSKVEDRYLHYIWDREIAGESYFECMGTHRILEAVSPFVKLEVIPSTTDPSSLVHIRCSHNGKYWRVLRINTVSTLSATADAPEEDVSKGGECTLFQPVFGPDSDSTTVWFRHLGNRNQVEVFPNNQIPLLHRLGVCYSAVTDARFFEFMEWESNESRLEAENQELRDKIQELKDRIRELEDKVAGLELREEERKAKLEEEKLTLQSMVVSAWDSFQLDVRAGIDPVKA